ncbi:Uncharacterised protein [Mycobacteroides abscessus subsp. abscessus]|nr:Uncharacterised protein [Mycobacteroides abscessus subsp. abscessus]
MESLTRGGIPGLGFDRQGVLPLTDGERDTGTVEHLGGGEVLPVDLHERDRVGDDVDEGL